MLWKDTFATTPQILDASLSMENIYVRKSYLWPKIRMVPYSLMFPNTLYNNDSLPGTICPHETLLYAAIFWVIVKISCLNIIIQDSWNISSNTYTQFFFFTQCVHPRRPKTQRGNLVSVWVLIWFFQGISFLNMIVRESQENSIGNANKQTTKRRQ